MSFPTRPRRQRAAKKMQHVAEWENVARQPGRSPGGGMVDLGERGGADVRLAGGHGATAKGAKRAGRTRVLRLSTHTGAGGATYDPRVALAWRIRRALTAPPRPPARLIDPTTGEVRGYMDPDTRRTWKDAACTVPLDQDRRA